MVRLHIHPFIAVAYAPVVPAWTWYFSTQPQPFHRLAASGPGKRNRDRHSVSRTVSNFIDARVATAGALLAAGARHVVVMDGAYHGHTTATIDLSPYKFNGPGGSGKCVPTLCCYRMGTPASNA